MKKTHWIAGLSLAGILAVSGTAAALTSGNTAWPSSLHALSFTPAPAAQTSISGYSSSADSSPGINSLVATPTDTSTSPATLTPTPSSTVAQSPSPATTLPSGGSTPTVPGNSSVAPTLPSSPSNPDAHQFTHGYGMMGGYGGSAGANGAPGYGMMGGSFNGAGYSSALTDQTGAANDMKASLANAAVNKSANTITYTGSDVKIVMLGGPGNADEKFVIGGLVNPTLNIPQGARVTMEFINEDTGMPHGVEITSATPPYVYMSMMQGGIYPGAFIHPIPVAVSNKYPVAQISFTAGQAGNFYYLCQYPGHAEKGMYGKIVIG